MPENPDAIVYQLLGQDGFDRLTAAFYRHVETDDILRPMYPAGDLEPARVRLRDFLIFRFGGPPVYIANRGHPRLRARHIPFTIDEKARDRWVELMAASMSEAGIPAQAAAILTQFFANTATFLINRAPPDAGAGFANNPLFPVLE